MKKSFLILLGGSLVFASCGGESGETSETGVVEEPVEEVAAEEPQVSVEQVWATDSTLETPESVFYDADANILYVSNIVGDASEKDGEGYISKVSPEGEIVEKEWVSGLHAPKGIAKMDGSLYVTDIDELVEINTETGEITNRYKAENATFLNDPIAADGKILFTDTREGRIYAFQDGAIEVWKEGLENPNGLAYHNGEIILATNNLQVVSETGEPQVLAEGIGAGDGIGIVDENSYLVSDWNGVVYYVNGETNQKVEVLNTKDQNMNTADIEYIQDQNLLLVPTFSDNRVVAYTLKGVE